MKRKRNPSLPSEGSRETGNAGSAWARALWLQGPEGRQAAALARSMGTQRAGVLSLLADVGLV